MSTEAIITMIAWMGLISCRTFYLFYKVLTVNKKKFGANSEDDRLRTDATSFS